MSILNCCGCINTQEVGRKDARKRYKNRPQKKQDAILEERDSSFFRPDDSKFRSVQTND